MMATAMPIMPNRLPDRDVTGDDNPRNARMNRTAATRYASEVRLADISAAYCFRLNIDSMRCVTTNPPKILTEASVTAMNPNAIDHSEVPSPVASMAPTMITEEIALVTAINGECNAGVTFHTT